jgi:anti-anti-sigma factor
MRTETRGDTLYITDLTDLGAANAALFKEVVHACLEEKHRRVDADFSTVRFVDSVGLGALLSIHRRLCERQSQLRLINPSDSVSRFLKMLHMDQVFEIVTL